MKSSIEKYSKQVIHNSQGVNNEQGEISKTIIYGKKNS